MLTLIFRYSSNALLIISVLLRPVSLIRFINSGGILAPIQIPILDKRKTSKINHINCIKKQPYTHTHTRTYVRYGAYIVYIVYITNSCCSPGLSHVHFIPFQVFLPPFSCCPSLMCIGASGLNFREKTFRSLIG